MNERKDDKKMVSAVLGLDVELDQPEHHHQVINEMDLKNTIHVSLNGDVPRPLVDIIGSYTKEGLYLISNDGTRFRLLKRDAQASTLLQTVYTSDDGFLEVSIGRPASVVSKIIEYLTESKQTPEWQNDYINKSWEAGLTLQIAHLADYLHIDSLMDLCGIKFALMIRGKSNREMKRIMQSQRQ